MFDLILVPVALHTALSDGDWPATWPPLARVEAALTGYPISAVVVATGPPAMWEEEAQAADPEWPLAPKLIITLATPDAKSRTVALAQTFAAHLEATLEPAHCERSYQDSLWTLDWAEEPAQEGSN
jgi:hypothetical protein